MTLLLLLLLLHLSTTSALLPYELRLAVNKDTPVHRQSRDHPYICATMDWWPNNKCDSEDGESNCAWINASILSAPLSPSSRLSKAAAALGKFNLRLGGTLADSITYDVGEEHVECPQFSPSPPEKAKLFTDGCLSASRWDEILHFCPSSSNCEMIFGINAMTNRTCVNVDPSRAPCFYPEAECTDTFDFVNAERIIRSTAARGYEMKGYEFGNELTCLSPEQYASSLKQLREIVVSVSREYNLTIPSIIATDSKDPDPDFFRAFVPLVQDFLYAAAWHSYPLGPGVYCTGPNAENNTSAIEMTDAVNKGSPDKPIQTWMGETGGAYDSGCRGSTNTFMSGFWYLNSLGSFAVNGHDMYCRQTFTGGNYELVNKESHIPNPDYYSTLLFGKLMGAQVLEVTASSDELETSAVRMYAHCTPPSATIPAGSLTLLYLNFGAEPIVLNDEVMYDGQDDVSPLRLEFVLTGVFNSKTGAADALHSDLVALNGQLLTPNITTGEIPPLPPRPVEDSMRFLLPAQSYGFAVYPQAGASACKLAHHNEVGK